MLQTLKINDEMKRKGSREGQGGRRVIKYPAVLCALTRFCGLLIFSVPYIDAEFIVATPKKKRTVCDKENCAIFKWTDDSPYDFTVNHLFTHIFQTTPIYS